MNTYENYIFKQSKEEDLKINDISNNKFENSKTNIEKNKLINDS